MSGSSTTGRGLGRARRPRGNVVSMPVPTVVRRRRMIKLGAAAAGLALLGAALARIYVAHFTPPSPQHLASIGADELAVMELVNRERVRVGVRPLDLSPRLTVVARGHSYDMAMRHYLAHLTPEGSTPADRVRGVGIDYRELAENIYMDDYPGPSTLAERAVKGWLESPHHRSNMLSGSFRQSGVGIAHSADGKSYVTQEFIR